MIKILHVLSSGQIGGTERMTVRLIRHMETTEFENHVAFFRTGGPIADELTELGVPVTVLDWQPMRAWQATKRLFDLLRSGAFDIVQTYGFRANLLLRPVAALFRVPVFVTAQRSIDLDRKPVHSLADRLTSPLVTLYLSNSEAAASLLRERERIPAEKVRVVHNGIDPGMITKMAGQREQVRAELGLGPGDICAGVICRLEPVKNLETLLRAIARLPAGYPLRFVVVGDGTQREQLLSQAASLGLSERQRLRFLGERQDVARLLSGFDLFVLPSLWEGLPGAVMEAMCAGLPVVATRVGGIPELVVDGVTGYLVDPVDEAGLTEAFSTLARDHDLRRAFGEAGYQRISEQFSLEAMVNQTEHIYRELCNHYRSLQVKGREM